MPPRRRTVSATTAILLDSQNDSSEAYRSALQAFIDRRRNPNDPGCVLSSPSSPDKERLEFFIKKNNENKNKRNDKRDKNVIPGVPHVHAPEIFEIGWVAGTEDRYMELIFAEWQNTRVSLRRHTHPDCRNAVKADLDVLTEIRHPNILLLMATTHTDDHGLVAIFEPVDCTLYNYVHEQGERVSVQGIAKCAGSLAGALKHAHMRGYIHGAISSHCVFLATCGTVKLGGWELAGSINNKKSTREYEERLRFEIYRWQAPEIFRGDEPSKATDIYGLTLLMWEMSTMNVPWNGLTKSEVERQYVQWERGVITDLYNFPPLLNNLLDAGLQLDVSKRTLDMSRMRRFLQTLEIQYEDTEPLYVEPISNNNNAHKPVFNTPVSTPPISTTSSLHKCPSTRTQKRCSDRRSVNSAKEACTQFLHMNVNEESKLKDLNEFLNCSQQVNETASCEILKHVRKGTSDLKINARNVNRARSNEKLSDPKVKKPKSRESQKQAILEDCLSAESDVLPIMDSTDEESFNDTRINIKKLKESLASKRENFFYGSDSSQISQSKKSENTKNRILTQVRSKDYEPHKPASHKTSLEPKQTRSGGLYNSMPPRTAIHQNQKSPYSCVPTAVRDAIVQPKVLNSDSQSFFESSLWKKEKMICISKMRKSNTNDQTFLSMNHPSATDTSSIDRIESCEGNDTYTIEKKADDTKNSTSNAEFNDTEKSTTSSIPRSKSLQALKDALDRATIIVKSTSPRDDSSTTASSPFKSPRSLEHNTHTSDKNESIFEELYELKHDELDIEIKSIERSINGEETFLVSEGKCDTKEISDNGREASNYVIPRRFATHDETKRASCEGSRLSNVVCESIAENFNENDTSSLNSKPDDRTIILAHPTTNPTHTTQRLATFELHNDTDVFCQENTEDKPEDSETSFALMVFSDKNRGCNSCNPKALARRRSLPAALGQLRNLSNVSLGKLPIRKVDVPDNTVEDIYIDDEFGDSLNVNMVLLDADATLDDEDYLPDLLELSDGPEYQQ